MIDKTAILNLPSLSAILREHKFWAHKSLGQNFILDLNITRRIARSAPHLDQGTIIEIGPGPGGLTRALFLEGAQKVMAIDKDPRASLALQSLKNIVQGALDVIINDATQINLSQCGSPPRQVVANLPYNVATPILLQLLRNRAHFQCLTLMFQKEVAERLIAAPRTPDYGRLSVIAQWCCEIDILFDLPPVVFTPPPQVTSSVVQLIPRKTPLSGSFEQIEKITHKVFQNRRKMLRTHFKHLTPEQIDILQSANIHLSMRPEELSVEQFCILSRFDL